MAGTLLEQVSHNLAIEECRAKFIIERGHVAVNRRGVIEPFSVIHFGEVIWVGRNFFTDSLEWVA